MFDKRRIRKSGERGKALVVSCETRSKLTSNELRDFDYVLEVRPERGEPFQAEVRDKFWIAGLRPREDEDDVPVRYDRDSHETVFDLDGDPRFDADAMNVRTAEKRRELREMKEAMGAVAPAPPAAADPIAQLERLVRLRDAGALSEDEFAAQKARILEK